MNAQPTSKRYQVLATGSAWVVLVVGLLSLGGWLLHAPTLRILPLTVAMKPNTAACLVLAGSSLWIQQVGSAASRRVLLARILAFVVLVVGLLTLAEYVFNFNLGLDELLFRDTLKEAERSIPGRMAPASAVNFLFIGGALLMLDLRWPGNHWPAQYCAIIALIVSLLAFIAFFYGVEVPFGVAPYVTIALHTVLGFWLLSLAVLFARPDRGVMAVFTSQTLGGILARRMLPAAILVPLLSGWLGVLGERAGLFGLGLGASILSTVIIVLFVTLIATTSRNLNRLESERRQAYEEVRALAGRLQTAREEERASLAREIHDVLAQDLTLIKIDLTWLSRRLSQPVEPERQKAMQEKLGGSLELANSAISSVQRIATDLRPVVLDTLGLTAAIEWQAKEFETRTGIRAATSVPNSEVVLDRDHSTAVFRILQESLTNVARHSHATHVQIDLVRESSSVVLLVQDNGRGISPEQVHDPRSVGLIGMRERATLLGGHCEILGSPAAGTTVEVRFPVAQT